MWEIVAAGGFLNLLGILWLVSLRMKHVHSERMRDLELKAKTLESDQELQQLEAEARTKAISVLDNVTGYALRDRATDEQIDESVKGALRLLG